MSEKILMIDGHSMLNRAFYGLPDLTNTAGVHTGAVYGFLNILLKILEEEQPDYLCVAFDLHAPTFRHEIYKEYKGTRKPMPEELREQVPLMKEMLSKMGVLIVTMEGYEADDILGTLARRSEERGLSVTILSGDRDLLQLATEQVMIRLPHTLKGKTTIEDYHAEQVKEKYQISPAQIIDLKALMGDSADNIPGIPGVGEKTATKILLQFDSLENAYAHLSEIKPKKAMESLRDHYDLAQLSRTLATIDTKAPISFDYEKARYQSLFTPEAYELCRQLELKNLLARFEGAESKVEDRSLPAVFICTDLAGFSEIVQKAGELEAAGLSIRGEMGRIACAALALSEKEIYAFLPEDPSAGEEAARLLGSLSEKTLLCAADVKGILSFVSLQEDRVFDAGVAAYLINPLKGSYPYEELARTYGNLELPSAQSLLAKKGPEKAAKEDPEALSKLCGYEALTALLAEAPLRQQIQEQGMEKVYEEIERPLIFTLHEMEKWGMRIRGEELKAYAESLKGRIGELEGLIYEKAGGPFNILSPKQLGEVLFERMGIPGGRKTKTGYSTAADVLEKLAPDYPIVTDILEYRTLTKLRSTYAEGLEKYIAEDGRIHSTFNQTITATGRISSADPNLQNIPVRMELGRQIRKVFVPEDGFIFLDADYSQIELRVLAHMSGDEKLIQAYKEAQDIHRLTASQVFHIPFEEVTPLQRRNAKAVNFGIVYGISSFGLSQDLSITRAEAKDYIEKYFATYPKIKLYLDSMVEKGKRDGYVTTLYGRRRPVPELASSNFMQRSFGERVAMNSPIQGTAADIIKIAMNHVAARLKKEGLRSRLVLQVHDELLIETALSEQEQVAAILKEEMEGAADLSVDLIVDMHAGSSWYEAK